MPVVFLTAFADAETLERAKRASPHGYIVKPFDERDLRATIEIALYRDGLDRALRRSHDDLLAVLDVQRTGNVLVDAAGRIVFANAAAGRILGADAWHAGRPALAGRAPASRATPGAASRWSCGRAARERQKSLPACEHRQPGDSVVEIEIEDDPRAARAQDILPRPTFRSCTASAGCSTSRAASTISSGGARRSSGSSGS